MTFRIQRTTTEDAVVLTLSGDIAADRTTELQRLIDGDADRAIVLDLGGLAVVDREGVLLLARSEDQGAVLANCPAYVREWIEKERSAGRRSHK